jgi:hypothetical protein
MLFVADEVSASEAEMLEMRKTAHQVFDEQEETKEEVVDEKKSDLDDNDDGSGDDSSDDSDDEDSDTDSRQPKTKMTTAEKLASGKFTVYEGRLWKVRKGNPRRPKHPGQDSVSRSHRKGRGPRVHRKGHGYTYVRARSNTPVRKGPSAGAPEPPSTIRHKGQSTAARSLGLTLMFMLTVMSPPVDGLSFSSESAVDKAVAREFCG